MISKESQIDVQVRFSQWTVLSDCVRQTKPWKSPWSNTFYHAIYGFETSEALFQTLQIRLCRMRTGRTTRLQKQFHCTRIFKTDSHLSGYWYTLYHFSNLRNLWNGSIIAFTIIARIIVIIGNANCLLETLTISFFNNIIITAWHTYIPRHCLEKKVTALLFPIPSKIPCFIFVQEIRKKVSA